MLYIDVKCDETLLIGDTVVTLVRKSGQLARLGIEAKPDMRIRKLNPDTHRVMTLHVRSTNDIIGSD